MLKSPILNALGASVYIITIVAFINLVSQTQKNKPDNIFAPIMFLSVLTLSAAVMAYLFFYQPLQLLIEGKKKEAVNLFIQTLLVFAVISAVISTLVLSGVLH